MIGYRMRIVDSMEDEMDIVYGSMNRRVVYIGLKLATKLSQATPQERRKIQDQVIIIPTGLLNPIYVKGMQAEDAKKLGQDVAVLGDKLKQKIKFRTRPGDDATPDNECQIIEEKQAFWKGWFYP